MLDECKAEKLVEVLVSFSTIVLQEVLAAEKDGKSTISRKFALASKLSQPDQRSLLPLAIAHRASLSALLRRKELLRRRYNGFQKFLDGRREELDQQESRLKSDGKINDRKKVSRETIEKAKKQTSSHWHGDSKWLEVLVEGDRRSAHDLLLDTPFEQTWKRLINGPMPTEPWLEKIGLLHDLETRVANQEARLRKWKQFRDELLKESKTIIAGGSHSASSKPMVGIETSSSAHKHLVLDSKKVQNPEHPQNTCVLLSPKVDEYEGLVNSLGQDLRGADQQKKRGVGITQQQPGSVSGSISKVRSAVKVEAPQVTGQRNMIGEAEEPHQRLRSSKSKEIPSASVGRSNEEENLSVQNERHQWPRPSEGPHPMKAEPSPTVQSTSSRLTTDSKSKANNTPNTDDDEDDLFAAEIVSLTLNAGPSPIKGKPSLSERTRQSMAFTSSHRPPLPDAPAMQPPFPRAARSTTSSKPAVDADVKATPLERTRQSMSLLPPEPRKPVHKPRFFEQFPTDQFETPRKQPARLRDLEETTPPEQLLSESAEYASVFKSRPKVAMSPSPSPMPSGDSSMVELIVDTRDSERNEQWDSSPLLQPLGRGTGS